MVDEPFTYIYNIRSGDYRLFCMKVRQLLFHLREIRAKPWCRPRIVQAARPCGMAAIAGRNLTPSILSRQAIIGAATSLVPGTRQTDWRRICPARMTTGTAERSAR